MIPIRIPGLLPPSPNSTRREHPMVGHRRVKRERHAVAAALMFRARPALPVTVTLVRCSLGTCDDDNLAGAFKAIRDEVANWLGIDDRDARVTWVVEQQKVKRDGVGVVIRVEARR